MNKINNISKTEWKSWLLFHAHKQIQNYLLALTTLPSARIQGRNQKLGVHLKYLKRLFKIKVPKP